ncbi:MAG: DUF1249 domain-containing protein [Oceanospirillales bacterium]|jgi:uncharacterized protein YqiB (DUF1249 family)|nr:MAG: DUF1249 domain-containing protein [Oceanospirillales bacterium]
MKRKYVPDLTQQMAICQTNYGRILRLLPELQQTSSREFDLCYQAREVQVSLWVEESFRYTSTVVMRQTQTGGSPWLESPDIVVRLYHDARMAEVICTRRRRQYSGVYTYPNANMHQPDEKYQLNQFLAEWLTQCLSFGCAREHIELS